MHRHQLLSGYPRADVVLVRAAAVLGCLLIGGCSAITPPPDTARVPSGAFGIFDNDVPAIDLAAWAFAAPERTQNDPVDAAEAAAGVDYLAGELSSNPRWLTVSPLAKQQMLQARTSVRGVLGIRPDAPSQLVVNALLEFAAAWRFGNQAAAMQVLVLPIFTLPPQQTFLVLSSMPYIKSANLATSEAATEVMRGGGSHGR